MDHLMSVPWPVDLERFYDIYIYISSIIYYGNINKDTANYQFFSLYYLLSIIVLSQVLVPASATRAPLVSGFWPP